MVIDGANGDAGYGPPDGRHLQHPARYYGNTGCGVTSKENFTNYTSYLTDTLGLPYGYVLFGTIQQKYNRYLQIYNP